jgi:hypothetical protein
VVRISSAPSGIIAAAVELQSFRLVAGLVKPTIRRATAFIGWCTLRVTMKLEFTENMNEMYSAFRATSDAHAWLTKHDATSWGSLAIGRCEYTRGNAVEPNGCYQAI